MLARLSITVPFGKTKVDDVDLVCFVRWPHQEIVGFHIPVDEVLRVHKLDPSYHLLSQHAHSFKRELSIALLEKVFQ